MTAEKPTTRFVAILQRHHTGICSYDGYSVTTVRLEGAHVAIGLIQKRAQGLLDTDYFKLRTWQSTMPEAVRLPDDWLKICPKVVHI